MSSSEELRTLASGGPSGLALATDKQFEYPPHIELVEREVCAAIRRARSGANKTPEILLVEMPPRHGKSTLISEFTPAWFLGVFPDLKVILTSYEADYAASWGRRVRDILEREGPELYGVRVDRSSAARSRWDIADRRGGMITAGIGGAITGRGAHVLIIDDPLKNAKEAMSPVIREAHWEWWLTTARTRLEPGAVVIILLTRWHEDDIAGRMMRHAEDGGYPVREIRLPAIAEEDDPLGREPGEALWPERYSLDYLKGAKRGNEYWFAAMYQGRPAPDEGGIFGRAFFRYFEISEDGEQAILHTEEGKRTWALKECTKRTYVDLAASEKTTADFTVCTKVLITPEKDLLIDEVLRERIPGPEQPDFLAGNYAGVLKVEQIGYQTVLIQELRRRGLPVEAVHPDKDKVTRAAAAGALYRGGKVYHRRAARWLGDFEAELLAFPTGEHDDQVDTVAYAARDLPDVGGPGRTQRRKGRTEMGGLLSRDL